HAHHHLDGRCIVAIHLHRIHEFYAGHEPSSLHAPASARRRLDTHPSVRSPPTAREISADPRALGPYKNRIPSLLPACRIATGTPGDRLRVCHASAPERWSHRLVDTNRASDPVASRKLPVPATPRHASPIHPASPAQFPVPLPAPGSRSAGTAADGPH